MKSIKIQEVGILSLAKLYGLFLVPLVLVTLGYALTFDSFGVADDDLKRLRRLSGRSGDE